MYLNQLATCVSSSGPKLVRSRLVHIQASSRSVDIIIVGGWIIDRVIVSLVSGGRLAMFFLDLFQLFAKQQRKHDGRIDLFGRFVLQGVPQFMGFGINILDDIEAEAGQFEGKVVEVEVWIPKIGLVESAGLKDEGFAVRRGQEMFLPRGRVGRDPRLFTDLFTRALGAFFDDSFVERGGVGDLPGNGGIGQLFLGYDLVADAQDVPGAQRRAKQVWLVGVDVAFQAWVDPPFHNAEGLAEARREAVADGPVEVVAEDEVGAQNVGFGNK